MLIGIDASRATRAQRTGTEAYSLHLIANLLALPSPYTFRLYFHTPPAPGLFPATRNRQDRVIPWPRLWTHLRLSWEMATRPPDVLFVPAHVLPVIHPRRSVVTIHDLGYKYQPEAHRPLDRLYLEVSTRYNAHAASHVIADSGQTRDDLVHFYGADPAKITVVHLGVDPAMQPITDLAMLAGVQSRLGIPGPYFLYVGTLQPRKNLVRLVEAFAGLLAAGDPATADLCLVLAGRRGWRDRPIFDAIARLGLAQRVIVTGYVDERDLPALYSGAVACCLPSLYEGFGLPALEAMACGAAVIAARRSSLPEVVGEAGLLVEPTDTAGLTAAMRLLLTDSERRRDLGRRGRERARQFSWAACARQVLGLLEQVGAISV